MSNHSVIEHRANYHFARIEEDYIAICLKGKASPHCKALILAILESWTNTKRSNGEEPIVYMTYPQWVQAMYWQHGRNAIIESLEELEKQGLIIRKPYRFKGKDTFAYVLNAQVVQECIKALPEKADGEYLPRFNLNAFKNKRVPNQTRPKSNANAVYNQTPDAFNNIPFIDSSSQLQSITSEEERGASPHVDAPRALSENKNVSHFGHNAWNCEAWCVAHNATCADYQAYIDSGAREETPTEPRTPIVTIGATNGTSTTDRIHSHPAGWSLDRPATEATPVKQTSLPAREASSAPPGALSSHEHNDGAATEAGSEPAPSGKPKRQRKKPVPVQLSLDGERLKEWYDELRGYGSSLSRRNVAAWNSLAQKRGSDDKETFRLVTALMDDDPWFEEHKVGVDPYWIDRQWENKYIFLQRKKPAPLADKKPLDIYAANSMDKEKMARRIEEMKANAARKGIQVPGHHGTN